MAGSVNRVILLGRLGKDPEMRYMQNGRALTTFSLATSRYWNDADGERKEETQWHNITAWERDAERLNEYLSKGDQVFIEGRINYRRSEGDDGQVRYFTDIVVERYQLLGSRDGGSKNRSRDGDEEPRESRRPARSGGSRSGGASRSSYGGGRAGTGSRPPARRSRLEDDDGEDNTIDLDDTAF